MSRYIFALIVVTLFTMSAQAHHSTVHFEREVSEMDGTLVDVHWRNPHIFFSFETEEANGEKKVWELEAATIYVLGRAGVTRDLFTIGERIRVAGRKSGMYDDKFLVGNILKENGEELLVGGHDGPRWNDDAIGSRESWNSQAFMTDEEPSPSYGIFRVWSPPTPGSVEPEITGAPTNVLRDIATERSNAIKANWDPYAFDASCERSGVPRVNYGPHPNQFVEDGENILLLSEEFYVTRTIHMNSDVDPSTQPLSPLGYSVGRWEDENTLVVETSAINFRFMNLSGYGQSNQSRMTERFVLDEEDNRLDVEVVVTDPIMLTEPHVQRRAWVDIGESINESYDCVPTTSSR